MSVVKLLVSWTSKNPHIRDMKIKVMTRSQNCKMIVLLLEKEFLICDLTSVDVTFRFMHLPIEREWEISLKIWKYLEGPKKWFFWVNHLSFFLILIQGSQTKGPRGKVVLRAPTTTAPPLKMMHNACRTLEYCFVLWDKTGAYPCRFSVLCMN